MRKEMEIVIDSDGVSRVKVMNEDPGHSIQLKPFQEHLSDGDKALIQEHTHDHSRNHGHVHGGAK